MGVDRGETFQKQVAPWGPRTHWVSGKLIQPLRSFWKITESLSPLIIVDRPEGSSDFCNP